jgi:hypothetical protein
LEDLDLSDNGLNFTGLNVLADVIRSGALQTVKKLRLSRNFEKGMIAKNAKKVEQSVKAFGDALNNEKCKIEDLQLRGNSRYFLGKFIIPMIFCMVDNSSLKSLDLTGKNRFFSFFVVNFWRHQLTGNQLAVKATKREIRCVWHCPKLFRSIRHYSTFKLPTTTSLKATTKQNNKNCSCAEHSSPSQRESWC